MPSEKNIQVLEETYTDELPFGIKDGDTIHKEFEYIEMNGLVEETIARPDIRTNMGKVINSILAICVKRVGDLTPQKLGRTKWEKLFQDMYLGDRDYIMLKLRQATYGDELDLHLQCPNCGSKFMHVVEFNSDIEMRPVQDDPEAIPFELPRGVKDKDGVLVTAGKLRLPTGEDQEKMDDLVRRNPGQANTSLLTRCVQSLGDIELSSMIVRNLNKRDREYLVEKLGESNFGPKFLIEIKCPTCSEPIETGVNPVNFL